MTRLQMVSYDGERRCFREDALAHRARVLESERMTR